MISLLTVGGCVTVEQRSRPDFEKHIVWIIVWKRMA